MTACYQLLDEFKEPDHKRDDDGKFSANDGDSGKTIEINGKELGEYGSDKELREAAKHYYKKNLQGTKIKRSDIGEITFTGRGIKETISFSSDGGKLKLIPALKDIISTGKLGEWEKPNHQRKDDIVAFIPITNTVKIEDKNKKVEVLIGKDSRGNLYYDILIDRPRKHFADNKKPIAGYPEQNQEPQWVYRQLITCTDNIHPVFSDININLEETSMDFADRYYSFIDNSSALLDSDTDIRMRHVVSIRDGRLDYSGFEMGFMGERASQNVSVYRTRETIEKVAPALIDIPIIKGGHIDTNYPVPAGLIVGYTRTSKIIEMENPSTNSTCAVAHEAEMIKPVDGLPDLSLGYQAKLRPYLDGIEQYDIIPHHHAAVEAGRCGGICSFKDEKTKENGMLNLLRNNKGKYRQFNDAEGAAPTLEEIAGTIGSFAEAVKRVPLDEKVMSVIAAMQAVIDGVGAVAEEAPAPAKDQESGSADTPKSEPKEQTDEDSGAAEAEKTEGEKGDDEKKPFADSKQFHDAVAKASQGEVQRYMKVVSKAQYFLPESYDYSSRTPNQIMKDTLSSQGYKNFSDEKLPVAFEMLRKETDYKTFGNVGNDPLDTVKDKEI